VILKYFSAFTGASDFIDNLVEQDKTWQWKFLRWSMVK
jgi:hypothetical protein